MAEKQSDHGAGDFTGPNGHQCNVMVGVGNLKPNDTYRLWAAALWEEMLVQTSSTPSRW